MPLPRVCLLLFSSALLAPFAGGAEPPVISPEVHADRSVTFRIKAPQAAAASVGGNFLRGRKLPLTREASGVWSVKTEPLAPDVYTYTFEVGGQSFPDPRNRQLKVGNNLQSLLIVGDSAVPRVWEERAGVPSGVLHHHELSSNLFGARRGYVVWTPPGYDAKRATPYPVLYLLHGSGDDEQAWTGIGRARQIAANLLAERRLEPCVIVMPFGLVPDRPGMPHEPGEKRSYSIRLFTRSLLEELLPEVENSYHVAREPARRAVAGLSFGGGQAAYAGLLRPDVFAWVGSFSASPPPTDWQEATAKFRDYPQRHRLVWIACGDLDKSTLERIQGEFLPLLQQHRVEHSWKIVPGAHEWKVWRDNLGEFLPLLFR